MALFRTTRWSLVLESRTTSGKSQRALEELCRQYRPPVLAYIRGRGHGHSDAEDLAQAFFESLLRYHTVGQAEPSVGHFRAFLLTALKRFLCNHYAFEHAAKRGGGRVALALDTLPIASNDAGPEQEFDRQYALTVIGTALGKLEAEARSAGKSALFDALHEYLLESPDSNEYAVLAHRLGLRRNTLAVAIHRLRTRLRELVETELAETVDSDAALAAELASLHQAIGRTIGN